MKKIIIAFCFLSSTLWASSYVIRGNDKTTTRYIERLLQKCEDEQKNAALNLKELEQCVLNARLFSEVNVSKADDKIIVEVKDRWSIIPFPSMKLNSEGKKSIGLFIFDANFLGMGTLLGVGGSYSTSSSSYILFYQDKSFLLSDWTVGFSTGKNNADIYWKNKNLKEMDAFHEKTGHSAFSLGYAFSNQFELEGTLGQRFTSYEPIKNYTLPQEYRSYMARLEATWKKEEYKFYFVNGYRLMGSVDQELSRSDSSAKTRLVSFNLFTGHETIHKQALLCSLNLVSLEGGDKRDALKSGRHQSSGKGLRGIPDGGYFTHFIASASADYQIPLRFTKYGAWTFAPFVDYGKINGYGNQSEDLWQKAYGLGSYFFLKGVMLPGVGFIIGRNETFKSTFSEFSVGNSF